MGSSLSRSQVSALHGKTLGFIGAGTMGRALMRGLIDRGVSARSLIAADPSVSSRRRAGRLGVRVSAENAVVAQRANVVVLAVKPQQMPAVLDDLGPRLRARQLVISIAAGITLRWLQGRLRTVPVVRVMPNLPATVRSGFAAYALGRYAGARHRAITRAICGAVGETVELPERFLDAMTAVSGSGPAYVFFLAHSWEQAAVALGLPRTVAQRAVRQTLRGSVKLLATQRWDPQRWIGQVASKKGTTEAALRVLARRQVGRHIAEAIRAAALRSRALSWA